MEEPSTTRKLFRCLTVPPNCRRHGTAYSATAHTWPLRKSFADGFLEKIKIYEVGGGASDVLPLPPLPPKGQLDHRLAVLQTHPISGALGSVLKSDDFRWRELRRRTGERAKRPHSEKTTHRDLGPVSSHTVIVDYSLREMHRVL